jgi:predicted alpha/beta-fold hydrolase
MGVQFPYLFTFHFQYNSSIPVEMAAAAGWVGVRRAESWFSGFTSWSRWSSSPASVDNNNNDSLSLLSSNGSSGNGVGLVHALVQSVSHAANDGLVLFLVSSFLISIQIKYQGIVKTLETTVDSNDAALLATAKRILQQENPYYPTYFSVFCDFHGNFQTITQFIWRMLLSHLLPLRTHRELLYLDDGGLISLDWMQLKSNMTGGDNSIPTASYANDRLVIISHGLCGSARSDYIAHISDILLRAGFRVCVVIRRGCDGLHIPRPSALFQHRNCEKTDLGHAIDHIAKNNPNATLYGLGYSMGAAHWLKEIGSIGNIHDPENRHNPSASNPFPTGQSRLKAAVCVCPPWDMTRPTAAYAAWSYFIAIALKHHLSHHIPTLNALGVDYNDVSYLSLAFFVWICVKLLLHVVHRSRELAQLTISTLN